MLYLVPSISLIVQSMSAWSTDRNPAIPQHYLSVCSDSTASGVEEGSVSEIQSPVTTDPEIITTFINKRPKDKMTVIFSTYHSLGKIIEAVKDVRKENKVFDIIFCDEAHRTTGIEKTENGKTTGSFFTLVHDNKKIASQRRLYLTATPKVYTEKKRIATDGSEINFYSMDNEDWFGPVFHRLSFTKAVENGYLSDFRVKIIMVPADQVDEKFQEVIAKNKDIPLDERSRMVGIWHALNYPDYDKAEWKLEDIKSSGNLLQRVIAFTNRIDRSEIFAGDNLEHGDRSFARVVSDINKIHPLPTKVEVRHIDGSTKAVNRNEQLKWLRDSDLDKKTCRIITNARCLSEGVDVPALDGIVFLNPRKSQVDVVQAVGRVMRRSANKKYGYVILPVVIPSGMDVSQALDQNEPYRVVWQVLDALKSHDDNLEIEINRLILDKNAKGTGLTERISTSVMGLEDDESIKNIFVKMKSKLVEKAGWKDHYDNFGKRLGKASTTVEIRIKNLYKGSQQKQDEIRQFTENLKQLVNDSVTEDDAIKIISHHVILSRVFNILFSGEFTSHNPMSEILDDMAKKIGMDEELEELEDAGFYSRVQREVEGIETKEARQNLIKAIYGSFLSATDKKGSDKHGVVYTPIEIIDFIIHSVDEILDQEFGLDFNHREVKVFDPFTGTGTFIARLIESGLITQDNLYEKYKHDMFANEIFLLAYYIALVNIETSYQSIRKRYVPFDGISYTDTLKQNSRYRLDSRFRHEVTKMFDMSFRKVHNRLNRQRWTHIHVIMGNPPYSSGQSSFDENNPNTKYNDLDKRIEETYARKTTAQNKNSLYDSYIRSMRWSSDRLGKSGIIAFITNAGFIRAEASSGLRSCLVEEFNKIWCFDLRGNARTQGETSRLEGEPVFALGSRAPTAITFLVKNRKKNDCTIYYKDIGNYHSRKKKLQIIKESKSISGIKDWQIIEPDKHNDWLNKRDDKFYEYMSMGNKKESNTIFTLYSRGIVTGRDAWAYNSSMEELFKNMKIHIDYCNDQDPDNYTVNMKKSKSDRELVKRLKLLKRESLKLKINNKNIRIALYRPFFKQYLYYDKIFTRELSKISYLFPTEKSKNIVMCIPDRSPNVEFMPFITNITPDLHIHPATQCFPYYIYEGSKQKDNITDYALNEFTERIKKSRKTITKWDIFYYVYGLLHHPGYKTKFVNNLSKQLPHIPIAPNFWTFADAGKKLADLHLNYDVGQRYNLGKPLHQIKKFTKLSFGKKRVHIGNEIKLVADTTMLKADEELVFDDIPEVKYRVNGRTPIEWIVDRYKLTTDKYSGIINDPTNVNIIALIERVVYVGIESDKIIEELSKEAFEPKDWKPKKKNLEKFMG